MSLTGNEPVHVPDTITGWVKLYHPRGPLCTLPLPRDPRAAFDHIDLALGVGWLVTAPGLELGESKAEIGWVARREKVNQNGSCSWILDLYENNEQFSHRLMTIYIDNDKDAEEFEYAAGIKVESIPVLMSTAPMQRGKSREADKLIIRMQRPFEIVYKANPKYNPEHAKAATQATPYKVPSRVFVRYTRQRPESATNSAPTASASVPSLAALEAELKRHGGSWEWAMSSIDRQFKTDHRGAKSQYENLPSDQLVWLGEFLRTYQRPAQQPAQQTAGQVAGQTPHPANGLTHKLTPAQAIVEYDRQMGLVEQAVSPKDFAALRLAYAKLVPSLTERQARDLIEYIDACEKSVNKSRGGK